MLFRSDHHVHLYVPFPHYLLFIISRLFSFSFVFSFFRILFLSYSLSRFLVFGFVVPAALAYQATETRRWKKEKKRGEKRGEETRDPKGQSRRLFFPPLATPSSLPSEASNPSLPSRKHAEQCHRSQITVPGNGKRKPGNDNGNGKRENGNLASSSFFFFVRPSSVIIHHQKNHFIQISLFKSF